jgi:hypothetical protein
MQKIYQVNEKLAAAGKKLEDVSRNQFDDIAHSVGLRQETRPEGQN